MGVEHERQRPAEQQQEAAAGGTPKPSTKPAVASTPSRAISSYIRVSCAYAVNQALNANQERRH